MVDIQTVFLTPGWRDWCDEFERQAAKLSEVVPTSDSCWISVGERQTAASVVVTIERHARVAVAHGWTSAVAIKESTYRYERFWQISDPTVGEVIDAIRDQLVAPMVEDAL